LMRQGVLQAMSGLPLGTVLNNFGLPKLGGGTAMLTEMRGRKLVVIYLGPRCKHCETLLPKLEAALRDRTDRDPAVVIVSSGTAEDNEKFFAQHRPACTIARQEAMEVSVMHGITGTPMAYLLDESGAVAAPVAVGGDAILKLLQGESPALPAPSPGSTHTPLKGDKALAASKINRNGLKAGTRAPDFQLPALDGSEISLASFRGRRVLLVFSDPNCGPCNDLLPKLENLHRNAEEIQVLLVGRGDVELNREKARNLGLTFPIVLQRSWEVSRAYAMFATPIAYLVSEDGVLMEDVAVAGGAILALADRAKTGAVQVAV
jgi:peroxiredoxin